MSLINFIVWNEASWLLRRLSCCQALIGRTGKYLGISNEDASVPLLALASNWKPSTPSGVTAHAATLTSLYSGLDSYVTMWRNTLLPASHLPCASLYPESWHIFTICVAFRGARGQVWREFSSFHLAKELHCFLPEALQAFAVCKVSARRFFMHARSIMFHPVPSPAPIVS